MKFKKVKKILKNLSRKDRRKAIQILRKGIKDETLTKIKVVQQCEEPVRMGYSSCGGGGYSSC